MAEKQHFKHNTDIGQNFLIDRDVVDFIVERSAPSPEDIILEIGPGDGVLTRGLLSRPVKSLTSIEVDERLRAGIEKIEARHPDNYRCLWGDAVRYDYSSITPPNKIIANLPYYITTPLLWTFLEQLVPAGVDYMLLMVQLESAERLVSGPGSRERSPLGVTLEAMGTAELVRKVPPSAFHPQPKVNSAIVEIKPANRRNIANDRTWRRLLAASFTQRRKTLANNWASGYNGVDREKALSILEAHGLKQTARAEELSLESWLQLAKVPEFQLKNKKTESKDVEPE